MTDLFLLSEAQMRRIEPFFPLSHPTHIGQRSCQTIDLIDNNNVDLPSADILKQFLKRRAVGRPARVTAIVVPRPD